MTCVLITGGSGYVGGRIAQAFLADGAEVRITTRGISHALPALEGAKICPVDYDDVEDLMRHTRGCDVIFHLAAANEIISGDHPAKAVRINIEQGLNVLSAARQTGVKRFVNFSTAHVYGRLEGRIDESRLPVPLHPYAISHLGFEHFVRAAMERDEIEGMNIRLSNALGAPLNPEVDRWTLIANDLCRQVATSRRIVLKSDGSQVRDFVALSDVARIAVGLSKLAPAQLDNGVFNLGSGQATSLLEVADMVADAAERLTGHRPEIERPSRAARSPEPVPVLEYRVEKLKARGLWTQHSLQAEIDRSLQACLAFFGQSS